ncbi:hypothetical protein Esti_002770 [Eimeria stiedai]
MLLQGGPLHRAHESLPADLADHVAVLLLGLQSGVLNPPLIATLGTLAIDVTLITTRHPGLEAGESVEHRLI